MRLIKLSQNWHELTKKYFDIIRHVPGWHLTWLL